MVKGLKMEEPPDALLPTEGGALEARVRARAARSAQCSAHCSYSVHVQMQGALSTTYIVCSLR